MRVFIVLLGILLGVFSCQSPGKEEYHLVEKMTQYQYYSHKVWLAGEASNQELVNFYLHEMEEVAEELIEKKVKYDGYDIAKLTEKMLLPAIEKLEESASDSASFNDNYQLLIKSCNTCHTTTNHGFIKIIRPQTNPFNHDFKKVN